MTGNVVGIDHRTMNMGQTEDRSIRTGYDTISAGSAFALKRFRIRQCSGRTWKTSVLRCFLRFLGSTFLGGDSEPPGRAQKIGHRLQILIQPLSGRSPVRFPRQVLHSATEKVLSVHTVMTMNKSIVQAIQKQTPIEGREQCDSCSEDSFQYLFSKASARGKEYGIYQCISCGLVQTLPRPTDAELEECYGAHYFENRTDRGYDNYFSQAMRKQLEKVWTMNLKDIGFFEFEASCDAESRRSLDVGCAAGYFVDYMRNRGWHSEGIELSEAAAKAGIEQLGLNIHIQDFLQFQPSEPYDVITLWASIEHLRSPSAALKKISTMLRPGGRLILSTCRWGFLSRMQGPAWRFLNVPEHLFYFSLSTLESLAGRHGLRAGKHITYGSGFTAYNGMGPFYRWTKTMADKTVKFLNQGDMMVYSFEKSNIHSLSGLKAH